MDENIPQKSSESSREQRVRYALESANGKIRSRFGIKKTLKIMLVLFVVCASLASVLLLLSFIEVKSIEISGAEGVYNESLICESAELYHGMSLFDSSSWGIKNKLKEELPLIEDVKVKKKLSGKMIIEIKLYEFEYFISHGSACYGLDKELKVTDMRMTREEYVNFGARYLSLPEIRFPIFKEKLVFGELFEETDAEGEVIREAKDEKDFEYIYIFLDFLYESGYFEDTNAVMLDRKFDVSIIWGGKYKIIFGDVTDLETKISVLEEIMRHDSLEYAEKAIIDVSSPSKAYARPDPSLDFSEYIKEEK